MLAGSGRNSQILAIFPNPNPTPITVSETITDPTANPIADPEAPVATAAPGADIAPQQNGADTDAPATDAATNPAPEIQYRTIVSYDPEEDLTQAYVDTMVPVVEGQLVAGTVVQVDDSEVLVDIGFKSEGVIPLRELSIRRDVNTHDLAKVGEHVEAAVLQREDREGRIILSKKRAQYERAWDTISKIKEADGVVEGTVIEAVKGGLILDVGLRGFLPASLVDLRRVKNLDPYVGQTMEAKILEIDRTRNNVVLSRRDWLQESQREERESFLDNLKVGERHSGVVASIVAFGAFVDMGGMDGLVHVSELSWTHIKHPTDVVNVGDEVEVVVLEVDRERERVSLSLRATQADPWEEFAETHQVGELVYGRITKLVSFGAFVQVGEVVEGLVHISELSTSHVESASQVVSPGEELWVKIIEIDLERRRISLSIKQAAEGGAVAVEYQEHFGEHAFDEEGHYVGDGEGEGGAGGGLATGLATDADEAWAEYYASQKTDGAGANETETMTPSYEVRDARIDVGGAEDTDTAAEDADAGGEAVAEDKRA